MSFVNGGLPRKSLLLVGPKRCKPSLAELTNLRSTIRATPDLVFLIEAVTKIEVLWPSIVATFPELQHSPGEEDLRLLGQFFQGEELPDFITTRYSNIVSDVVTVLSHIVDFWRLATAEFETPLFETKPAVSRSNILQEIQGFCLGFLTAAVVSSSRDESEFKANAVTILRIAACIGAVVEYDAVKLERSGNSAVFLTVSWSSQAQYVEMSNYLGSYQNGYISCITVKMRATVTLPAQNAEGLKHKLSASGLSVQTLTLQGRYHCRSAYEDIVPRLKKLFGNDERLQLPTAADLVLPLRSNLDGERISGGSLHDIALDSILVEQCQWYKTVRLAVVCGDVEPGGIVPVGPGAVVPHSLVKSAPDRNGPSNGASNGILNGASNGIPNGISNGIADNERPDVDETSAIAVIGMACRYPEADSVEEFWELLSAGRSVVRVLPEGRFQVSDLVRQPKPAFWGNFLRHPDHFDHRFFGISGREAKNMDPQQRLVMQVAYEALESAGYFGVNSSLDTNVGCYLGVGSIDYADNVAAHDATAFSALGTLRAFTSGRVSHHFGWSGPSITYDTACSSGAVAINAAVKAIRSGECSMALAGGVNVITSPALFQNLAAGSFLSPTGASKAFDASANGYCRGEGAGILLLKPLARARADGDSILAAITGSAVNQGANCTPITVPVSNSQVALYNKALSISGIDPKQVSYVEAHGTGTPVGDPIECESIRVAFGGPDRADELLFGSVKDNIGHTETSSGAAGLIKTILMMQRSMIPMQANFKQLNPKIAPLEPDRMVIPRHTQPWRTSQRIAVVNNYGAAGSNAVIVVQDIEGGVSSMPATEGIRSSLAEYELPFFIAAKTRESLVEYCIALKSNLSTFVKLHGTSKALDVAYNLSVKQNRGFEYNYSFTASTIDEVASKLDRARSIDLERVTVSRRPVVLCFGGQTGRTVQLDKGLYNSCKPLQTHLGDCEQACQAQGLPSLFPLIFSPEPVHDLVSLHCLLFALQYATAKTWLDCGIVVNTIVGHSFGQITGLVVAGGLSLWDGLRFISERARRIQSSWGRETGAMLSINGDDATLRRLLEEAKSQYADLATEVACYNGPQAIVLVGDNASIDAVEKAASAQDFRQRLKAVRLRTTHAFHSRFVDGILPYLCEVAASLDFRHPSIPVEACSRDQDWTRQISPETLAQQSRMPVYFDDAIKRIASQLGPCVFLEAGSASPIVAMARRALPADMSGTDSVFQAIDTGSPDSLNKLSRATSNLWRVGTKVQYWPFHHSQKDNFSWINLPPYRFQKVSHWVDYVAPKSVPPNTAPAVSQDEKLSSSPLLDIHERSSHGAVIFRVNAEHEMFRHCTEGHAVLGQSLCPLSMYVELAFRAANQVIKNDDPLTTASCVKDIKISSPLSVGSGRSIFVRLDPVNGEPGTSKVAFFSRSESNVSVDTHHANGVVSLCPSDKNLQAPRMKTLRRLLKQENYENLIKARGSHSLNGNIIYQVFCQVVDYAPYYRGVAQIVSSDREAAGVVNLSEPQPSFMEAAYCDPITLDNFLQVAGIHVNCLSERVAGEVFVCTELGELFLSDTFLAKRRETKAFKVYSSFERTTAKITVNDIFAFDPDTGDLVVFLLGAVFQSVPTKSLARTLSHLNSVGNPEDATAGRQNTLSKPSENGVNNLAMVAEAQVDTVKTSAVAATSNGTGNGLDDALAQIQGLFGRVLDIPTHEIGPTIKLTDLGIDSLMSTEILSEIKTHFNVSIPAEQFQELSDVQSLSHLLLRNSTSPGGSMPQILSSLATTSSSTTVQPRVDTNGHHRNGDFDELLTQNSPADSQDVELENPFVSAAAESFKATKRTFDAISQRVRFANFDASVFPDQMNLVLAYIVEAFQDMGVSLAGLRQGDKVQDISVLDKHHKVKSRIYQILEEADIVQRTAADGGFVRGAGPVPLDSSEHLHQAIMANFPQHVFEHNLLASTGAKLADCLTGQTDPLAILFGTAKARVLMESVYTHAPMFKAGTINLAEYLVKAFEISNASRPIRILELGAGTGGTTKHLVECLVDTHKPFQYTFTDLSSSLVSAAKKKFGQYDFMRYAIVDIEREPAVEYLHHYDIVISTNCIHATKDLDRSCTNINKYLQPGGILCLVELTRNLPWFDLVFGLLEGWWLFEDGRQHALATETMWRKHLSYSGFAWVDWTVGSSPESNVLRVITASPSNPDVADDAVTTMETVTFKRVEGVTLEADIYYPQARDSAKQVRPIALMIHGGGHVMLSRKDIRPTQTAMLLAAGFLPVSVDYRLCPETTLLDGPMRDICDSLAWARNTLPRLSLLRRDITPNGDCVVAVGWSTGGHLALTLGFTAPQRAIPPPQATLAFYCGSDYEDPFWSRPNFPFGQEPEPKLRYNLLEGVRDHPITAYNPPSAKRALGGWMATTDPRSRIALHMNWTGRYLRILLNGLGNCPREAWVASDADPTDALPEPSREEVQAVSPLAQIRRGAYHVPTFLIHGTRDDLIPWEQAVRTYEALQQQNVASELRILDGAEHLFDMYRSFESDDRMKSVVGEGYAFLCRFV